MRAPLVFVWESLAMPRIVKHSRIQIVFNRRKIQTGEIEGQRFYLMAGDL